MEGLRSVSVVRGPALTFWGQNHQNLRESSGSMGGEAIFLPISEQMRKIFRTLKSPYYSPMSGSAGIYHFVAKSSNSSNQFSHGLLSTYSNTLLTITESMELSLSIVFIILVSGDCLVVS